MEDLTIAVIAVPSAIVAVLVIIVVLAIFLVYARYRCMTLFVCVVLSVADLTCSEIASQVQMFATSVRFLISKWQLNCSGFFFIFYSLSFSLRSRKQGVYDPVSSLKVCFYIVIVYW